MRHPWIAQQRQSQSPRDPIHNVVVQSSRASTSSSTPATAAIPSHSQISTPLRRIVKTGISGTQQYQPSSSAHSNSGHSNSNTTSIPSSAPPMRVRTQSTSTTTTSKFISTARLGSQ